jgi:hypothetical protein
MPGRSLRVVTLLLVAAVLGCSTAPPPSPVVTQPPVPAEFVPWPDIVWKVADLPRRPLVPTGERIVSVTATPAAFVAVGYREVDTVRDGVVWRSPDGERWNTIDVPGFDGIELVDIAPAPGGFAALGVTSGAEGDRPSSVVFGSADGATWQRLPALPSAADTYPTAVAGGPDGVIVIADAAGGGEAAWRAADGRSFEQLTLRGPAAAGLIDPQAVADGFVALPGDGGTPTLLRSADGLTWTGRPIDATSTIPGIHVIVGRWGSVVQGMGSAGCGAACPVEFVAWWSGDGDRWGRLAVDSPLTNGTSIVVAAGDHGLLAIDGADGWSSPDGWAWRSLPEPGDGSVTIDDAVVRGDMIVAVGAEFGEEDGTSSGRILVAR